MHGKGPMADPTGGFRSTQRAFTAHIRDPEHHPAPEGVEDRRMAVYRELFFNNVAGFIESGFPVLHRLYGPEAWLRLVRDFFARHRCRTPLFLEIAEEFLAYLDEEHEPRPEDPPFLRALAHYEWVELALSVDEAEADLSEVERDGDLLDGVPVLSPVAWLLSYDWPVHRIGPDFRPEAPSEQPHYLMVYRNPDDEVGFMELNPVTARLVQLIGDGDDTATSGRILLETIAREIRHPDPRAVVDGGVQTLEALHRAGVILGTRKSG